MLICNKTEFISIVLRDLFFLFNITLFVVTNKVLPNGVLIFKLLNFLFFANGVTMMSLSLFLLQVFRIIYLILCLKRLSVYFVHKTERFQKNT